ncbi:hypothetical protein LB505_009822 [Fusarium chuoi]|nr:hypothetical protein LB505_009822 [Fusarium chuoi]
MSSKESPILLKKYHQICCTLSIYSAVLMVWAVKGLFSAPSVKTSPRTSTKSTKFSSQNLSAVCHPNTKRSLHRCCTGSPSLEGS